MRLLALALFSAWLLALAAPTLTAAQTPFGSSPNLQTQPAPEPEAPKRDEGGLTGWQTGLILLAGALLLAAITYAVLHDANVHNAAAADGHEEDRARARAEREAEHHRRKTTNRKKGKAAKQARRSNRPH